MRCHAPPASRSTYAVSRTGPPGVGELPNTGLPSKVATPSIVSLPNLQQTAVASSFVGGPFQRERWISGGLPTVTVQLCSAQVVPSGVRRTTTEAGSPPAPTRLDTSAEGSRCSSFDWPLAKTSRECEPVASFQSISESPAASTLSDAGPAVEATQSEAPAGGAVRRAAATATRTSRISPGLSSGRAGRSSPEVIFRGDRRGAPP